MSAGASGCGADPFSEQELATWYGFLKMAVGAELLLLHLRSIELFGTEVAPAVARRYAWVVHATTRRALVQRIRERSVPVLRTVHE